MQMFDNTSIDRIIKAINSGCELKPEFIASYVRWCVEQSQKPSTRKFVGGQRYYRVRIAKFNGWM